ncbi:Putative oxidoreductase SadH [BD1-7 clade bacterium]|uniref:Oxidoreductase SadH n=1 Tax=BD1-7 clade bacterium TaxID=2029982 RepID=A0A5S9QLG3_9GAMM|nr:Putative oxidoreductase SadH [BD1-7 clade bacterium]
MANNNFALVTGGASGMGRLAAQNLAKKGMKVAILDINADGLQETAEGYDNIFAYQVDVTDTDAVFKTVETIVAEHGNLYRVMHAAAIMPYGKILDHDAKDIIRVMDINYGGMVNITKATLPYLLDSNAGEMIVFSSMLGVMPVLATGAYSASKFATSAFVEIMSEEHKNSGITFVCVCPPAVKTPLLQQAKDTIWPKILDENPPISPEEVLEAVEKAVKKGEFWVFPGKGTRIGAVMRRLFPRNIWKHIHKVEGW